MAKELLSNLPSPGVVTAISTLKNELKKGETTFELETGLAAYFETAESQFRLVIGHEILLVTKVESSGKKLTVTRNQGENSIEEDHPAKANVFNFVSREALEKWVKEQSTAAAPVVNKVVAENTETEPSATKDAFVTLQFKPEPGKECWLEITVMGVLLEPLPKVGNFTTEGTMQTLIISFFVPKGKKYKWKSGIGEVKSCKAMYQFLN